VPYDECKEFRPDGTKNDNGKKMRNSMKSVVLGLMYGRGAKAIAEQLQIAVAEAKNIIDMFFNAFPNVYQYIQDTKRSCKQLGFVQTVFGRKRRLPEINLIPFEFYRNNQPLAKAEATYFTRMLTNCRWDEKESVKQEIERQHGIRVMDNGGKIAEAERQSVNSIIQGTSADITKKAMLALATHPKLVGLGAKMILTVHDEIIVEAPIAEKDWVAELMAETMIEVVAKDISVPMKVDSEITDRWYGEPM
jgi:DNA polymerase I-like protein with 3'-5' exonuclease and polymerase domains